MDNNQNLPGDWGPPVWLDQDGTTANNGAQVVANDVLTQSTVTQGQDRWTGWFQGLVGNTVQYLQQRDAAERGLVQQRASNGQPVYVSTQAAPVVSGSGITGTGLAIILAAVVGGVLLVAKKG